MKLDRSEELACVDGLPGPYRCGCPPQPGREFGATAGNAGELLALIDRTEAQARSALEGATAQSWGDLAFMPGIAPPRTRRSSVVRAIRHLGEHVGHLQLTRQLWESQRQADS